MSTQAQNNPFPYSDSNKRYHTFDYFAKHKFSAKCAKLPVDGGFTCPNRDGSVGIGGCIYCSARGSGDFCADKTLPIGDQLERELDVMRKKWKDPLGIAYFQAFTNTYAPVDVLREKFEAAIACPGIVGLSVATRADCLPPEVCEYLADLAERTFLTVELGLQTIHDDTARLINRGHSFADFVKGFGRLRKASGKINICVHLIDGLPGETPEMMLESARAVAMLHPEQVKLHLLHVLEGTKLAELYRSGAFECLTLDEYTDIIISQLEVLPADIVVGRVTGDGLGDALIAPLWSKKKLVVMNTIDKKMFKLNTFQGIRSHDVT